MLIACRQKAGFGTLGQDGGTEGEPGQQAGDKTGRVRAGVPEMTGANGSGYATLAVEAVGSLLGGG